MKAVILAGGLGTRLKPLTDAIPKPLLPVGESSLLELQVQLLKKHGINEVIIATNYKSDYIEKFLGDGSRYGVKLSFSKEHSPLGTVGPLSLIREKLTEPFVVQNGDILSTINYTTFFKYAEALSTPLTVSIKKHKLPCAFGIINFEGDYVESVEEKPLIERDIIAGIYMMTPDIFNFIPSNQYFGMDDLIKLMLQRQMKIGAYHMNEYWLDIGQLTDYEKVDDIYHTYFKDMAA